MWFIIGVYRYIRSFINIFASKMYDTFVFYFVNVQENT